MPEAMSSISSSPGSVRFGAAGFVETGAGGEEGEGVRAGATGKDAEEKEGEGKGR